MIYNLSNRWIAKIVNKNEIVSRKKSQNIRWIVWRDCMLNESVSWMGLFTECDYISMDRAWLF